MGDPGLPLTTGEGNTADWGVWLSDQQGLGGVKLTEEEAARLAHDLFAVLAECERLREQLDAARQTLQAWHDSDYFGREPNNATRAALLVPCADCGAKFYLGASMRLHRQKFHPQSARAALGVEGPAENTKDRPEGRPL